MEEIRERFNAAVISVNPLVVSTKTSYRDAHIGDAIKIAQCFNGRKGAIIVVPAWTWRNSGSISASRKVSEFKKEFPDIRLIIFAADDFEKAAIKKSGAEVVVVNQNAFLDFNKFKILSGSQKNFDAVYTAQMLPFKRHALAKSIKKLAIIYYGDNPDYQREVEAALPEAYFPNGKIEDVSSGARRKFLNTDEVAEIYSQSLAGLCLSAEEGTMWASAEYLLCGLPAVTTENIGGRDTFFDDYNSFRCSDTEYSVHAAIERAIEARRSSEEIRNRCIMKILEIRKDFYQFMESLRADFGNKSQNYEEVFMSRYFRDKLWKRQHDMISLQETISREEDA